MKENAPHKSDKDFKNSKIYMTKVGRFIRKTSIDELPQLVNILKGEMSFVGPRPFIINEGEINLLRSKMLYTQYLQALPGGLKETIEILIMIIRSYFLIYII